MTERKMTEGDWAMSLEVVKDLRANPDSDWRVIIADWLREARVRALCQEQRRVDTLEGMLGEMNVAVPDTN